MIKIFKENNSQEKMRSADCYVGFIDVWGGVGWGRGGGEAWGGLFRKKIGFKFTKKVKIR